MPALDTLGRRTRTRRQQRGKRIGLRARDLLWFEKIREHGPLPTSYLLEFSGHLAVDRTRALKRLADLYHEGGYLDRPEQQFHTIDARYNQLVYDLDSRAEAVLQEEGRHSDHSPRPTGPWTHRLMVSCITASLELAARKHRGLRYTPQHAILAQAGVGLRIPISFQDPTTGRKERRDLIPDALCGIHYLRDGPSRYLLLAVEADRHTEPVCSRRIDRKSFRRSILQYREFIGRGLYKEHFKITAPLLVLTVTTSTRHMRHLVELVGAIAPSGKNSFMCFQAVPAFASPFKPPQPIPALLAGPWERAGHDPASIAGL